MFEYVYSFMLNVFTCCVFNPSMPASVHSTDNSAHASVNHTGVNAFECTTNLKPLHLGYELDLTF
jgi:hypothetical protein